MQPAAGGGALQVGADVAATAAAAAAAVSGKRVARVQSGNPKQRIAQSVARGDTSTPIEGWVSHGGNGSSARVDTERRAGRDLGSSDQRARAVSYLYPMAGRRQVPAALSGGVNATHNALWVQNRGLALSRASESQARWPVGSPRQNFEYLFMVRQNLVRVGMRDDEICITPSARRSTETGRDAAARRGRRVHSRAVARRRA